MFNLASEFVRESSLKFKEDKFELRQNKQEKLFHILRTTLNNFAKKVKTNTYRFQRWQTRARYIYIHLQLSQVDNVPIETKQRSMFTTFILLSRLCILDILAVFFILVKIIFLFGEQNKSLH